ncbi:retron system putative HNH endonuclease [Phormidesmis sp. 146-33]
MKYIKKNQEPQNFTNWKKQANENWKPDWEANFQAPEKPETHEALLIEQGYICCYCGRRIDRQSSHIEHFQPRTHYPELALEYTNFLASCPGYPEDEASQSGSQPAQEHCGQKKGAWYDQNLTISPLIENCADYFRYTKDGQILTSDIASMQPAAQETIQQLGLDYSSLRRARARVIEAIEPPDGLTPDEAQKLIQSYEELDEKGKYGRFCATIVYRLQQYIL